MCAHRRLLGRTLPRLLPVLLPKVTQRDEFLHKFWITAIIINDSGSTRPVHPRTSHDARDCVLPERDETWCQRSTQRRFAGDLTFTDYIHVIRLECSHVRHRLTYGCLGSQLGCSFAFRTCRIAKGCLSHSPHNGSLLLGAALYYTSPTPF